MNQQEDEEYNHFQSHIKVIYLVLQLLLATSMTFFCFIKIVFGILFLQLGFLLIYQINILKQKYYGFNNLMKSRLQRCNWLATKFLLILIALFIIFNLSYTAMIIFNDSQDKQIYWIYLINTINSKRVEISISTQTASALLQIILIYLYYFDTPIIKEQIQYSDLLKKCIIKNQSSIINENNNECVVCLESFIINLNCNANNNQNIQLIGQTQKNEDDQKSRREIIQINDQDCQIKEEDCKIQEQVIQKKSKQLNLEPLVCLISKSDSTKLEKQNDQKVIQILEENKQEIEEDSPQQKINKFEYSQECKKINNQLVTFPLPSNEGNVQLAQNQPFQKFQQQNNENIDVQNNQDQKEIEKLSPQVNKDPELQVVQFKCKHIFHFGCILKWIEQSHMKCPTCRSAILF